MKSTYKIVQKAPDKNAHKTFQKNKSKSRFKAKFSGKALAVAILSHVVLLIFAFFISFNYSKKPEKPPYDFIASAKVGGGGSSGVQHQIQNKKLAQIAPTTIAKRIFAQGVNAQFKIPEMEGIFSKIAKPEVSIHSGLAGGLSGSGGGLGGGFGKGVGKGFGDGFAKDFGIGFLQSFPLQMSKRCSKADRLQRLEDKGGTPGCEDAVVRGLQWLKANQNKDGSWGTSYQVAMTGLALLAYFGHCETPTSEEFGESSMKGIVYLVSLGIKNQGRLSTSGGRIPDSYEHAIGTYALGEAVTFCKEQNLGIPFLIEVTQKAAYYILGMQNTRGSWDYSYKKNDNRGDISISGWQMQALKACRNVSIKPDVLAKVVRLSMKYINSCQGEEGSYGYDVRGGGGKYEALTGVGMLCNQIWVDENSLEVKKAAEYIYSKSKFEYHTANSNLYGHYYESQAMIQMGGRYWKKYNAMFRDILLENQNKDGSWDSPRSLSQNCVGGTYYTGDKIEAKIYRTTLCVLMLEVYYRYLSNSEASGVK
jgi:hypothetical protein